MARKKTKRPPCSKCGGDGARYKKHNPETGLYDQDPRCKTCRTKDHTGRPPKWKKRYRDIVTICRLRGVKLMTTDKDFVKGATRDGAHFKPKIKCLTCNMEVTNTSVNSFVNNGRFGCACSGKVPWSTRYDELYRLCVASNKELITSEKDFDKGATRDGKNFKPKIKCLKCNMEVTNTSLNHFVNHGNFGCGCHNKTETRIYTTLCDTFPDLVIHRNNYFCCDGWSTTHKAEADIVVFRADGTTVLAVVEVDGPHHFDPTFCYSGSCPDPSRFLTTVRRDCLKNKHWSNRRVSILRLVWDGDGIEDMATTFVRDCLAPGTTSPIIRVSDPEKYNKIKSTFLDTEDAHSVAPS